VGAGKDRAVAVVRGLVAAIGAITFALFAYVALCRFRYPIDAEWLTGAVREGVGRVARGQPLYVAPSDGFIPFVYPPLYYWACAVFARVMPVFVACKVVSVASTVALAWAIWKVARALGATRYWAFAGVLLHFGAFAMTLMFYDLERVDAFAAAVVALAVVALVTGEDRRRTAVSGLLLGLAFFAKQPHILSLVAACGALWLAGEKKRAMTVGAIGGATFLALFAYLEITTHGWFRYYCVTLPGVHGIDPKVVSSFFIVDWPKGFAIVAASLALGAPLAASVVTKREAPAGWSWQHVLVSAIVLATMLEAFLLRAHRGGWSNVIIAWTPFGCMAAAIVASRLEARAAGTDVARTVSLLLLAGVGFELLGGVFDPNDAAPDADDLAERTRFIAFVRDLEQKGDVVVTTSGDVTARAHFQMAALYDILRAGRPLPTDLADNLRTQKYAAIVVAAPHELQCDEKTCDDAFVTMASHYFVAARREEREHSGMAGFDARPRWVMRPRKRPIADGTKATLDRLLHVEMGLAEAEMLTLPPDTEPTVDDAIEERASTLASKP
jgi:hypothetical protein